VNKVYVIANAWHQPT